LLTLVLFSNSLHAATPVSTQVNNTAYVNYDFEDQAFQVSGNASFTTADTPAITPSVITLMHNSIDFAAQYQAANAQGNAAQGTNNSVFSPQARTIASSDGVSIGGSFPVEQGQCATSADTTSLVQQSAPKNYQGTTLTLPNNLALNTDEYFKVGDTIFVHLQDQDQNYDDQAPEKIVVTLLSEDGSDQETIQLTETGNSTGLFTGYIQTVDRNIVGSSHFDCQLSVTNDTKMQARYQDKFDKVDFARAAAFFDPNSYVISSDTGEFLSGLEVTLLDDNDNVAQVLSDEGGIYPNPVTTGNSYVVKGIDGADYTYAFKPGGYIFPVVDAGSYKIRITNSIYHDYPIPEQTSLAEINALPNGPFNLDEHGSRARVFTVTGNTIQLDVPVDPKDNSVILTKSATKTQAGVGEIVAYNIKLKNSEIPGDNITIHDILPIGLRYIAGSAKLSGVAISDPTISQDGRSLRFAIGDVLVDESLTLQYLTRIGVHAPLGMAVNTATLEDDDHILVANTTTANIEIREDLFIQASRLFGRVYVGSCGDDRTEITTEDEGISGVRIYLEDGSYVVSDDDGLWHMENIQSGSHVVQLDKDTLPKYLDLMSCDNYGQHSGRAFSQFVDLQEGSFWRSDFVVKLKPPSKGEVTQRLSSRLVPLTPEELLLTNSPVPQKIVYRVALNGTEVVLKDLRSLIMLPEGVSYKAQSARFDGQPILEPKKYDEQTLLFSLNNPGKDWQHVLEFEGWISKDAQAGELTTRSVAMFNAPIQNNQRTPLALTSALLSIVPNKKEVHRPEEAPTFSSFSEDLSPKDVASMQVVIEKLKGLKELQIEVAGHTDSVPIAYRSRHIFENNYQLSLARARSAANYLIKELKLQPHQVSISGFGSKKPVVKNSNDKTRSQNRRVEVNILAAKNGMNIAQADSGNQMVATLGLAPGGFDFPEEATASGDIREVVTMPALDQVYLSQSDNSFAWLWPSGDYLPNIPSTKIALKHAINQRIQLKLNGLAVSQLNFAKRETYPANQSAISLWSGVDLKEGNNHFEASLLDVDDNVVDRLEFDLHYASTPSRIEFIEAQSQAVADGVIAPVIAVKLFDKDGYPVRNGLQGEFTIDSPYYALDPKKNRAQINRNDFKPNYEITSDGTAYITLEPTTQAGEAVLRFPLANGQEEELRVWLKPQNREWLLVALAEGTIGYQDISGHVKNAQQHDVKKDFYSDGRLALFAKGQVLGSWLLTAAYDSAKGKTTPFEKLLDPNKYYTLYGDSSQQKMDASMEGKLYLRIERDRFYTVFGDYSTNMSKTELSKYLRKFHGIQSVYQGDEVSFNAFVTESAQRFERDEIQGDGTSGLYQLTASDIISNSETISIQVRDRFRSEIVLSEVELVKDSDYSIDYFDGSIFFKTPIQSTDENLNPRYIIARYETKDDSANDLTYGGRVALHALDNRLEVGSSLITEQLGQDDKTLRSVDMQLKLTNQLEVKAEVAHSEQNSAGTKTKANANLVSVDYQGEQFQAKAYIRNQEAGFGLNQINSSEQGSEKLGTEGRYYFTSGEYINVLFSDQNTLGSAQRNTLLETKYYNEYEFGRFNFGARVNQMQDSLGNTTSHQQLLAGHSYSVFDGRLLLNGSAEINIKKNDDVYDLLRLGSDWRLYDSVTLYGLFETGFESNAPQRTVIGLRATPWQGMQLSNSVEQLNNKDGVRLFAVHGLNQEINLDDHWQISFGFDQAQDLENSILDQSSVASTSDDFYALSTGFGYRSPTWQWTNRLEYRNSGNGEKWNALSGLYRPVALGLAMGINGEYRLDNQISERIKFSQVEFDVGLRPLSFGLAWLNQTKYIEEQQESTGNSFVSRRFVNNTHVNMRWNKTQVSAQYGLKYVDENFDGTQYSGIIDLIGMQLRHHITPKWDWGVHLQRLYDYEIKDSRHSLGASIGLTPQANTWVSFGYNFAGFSDSDFDGAGYSAHGIYMKIRIKADQDNLANLRNYFQ